MTEHLSAKRRQEAFEGALLAWERCLARGGAGVERIVEDIAFYAPSDAPWPMPRKWIEDRLAEVKRADAERAARLSRMDATEPVGSVEIAERLGVERNTVDQWRQRPVVAFPAPRWTVGGRPAWAWGDVHAWAIETGRIA